MGVREDLSKEFDRAEVQHFEGRGGKTFDYIEDETVMDRLDDALGVGSWSINVEPISVADGIVKVSLEAIVDGKGVVFQDFGYANNTNGEALKEAVSDGIRRCGRYLGIARELYKKHGSNSTPSRAPAGRTPSSTPRPAAPLRAVSNDPEFPDDGLSDAPQGARTARSGSDNSECEEHGIRWNGEWGDLWHKNADGSYCRHPENTRQEGRQKAGSRR